MLRCTSIDPLRSVRRHAPLFARMMVLVVALFHGWLASASVVSSSHDSIALPAHHSDESSMHAGGHGHSHDEPEPDEHDAGHRHGHNAADHSHDKLDVPRAGVHAALQSNETWRAVAQTRVDPGPSFPFERPPKTIPKL